MRLKTFLATALVLASIGCASTPPPPPAATSGDEFEIATTVLRVYNVISGPAGRRDWDRFKELFVPGARLIVAKSENGEITTKVMTTDEYATQSQTYFKDNGFFEQPVATRIERFGDIAQVFSTYESRHASSDEKPFTRGINSVQLVRSGGQWRIVTIFWEGEDATRPIPPRYLPAQ
jgi:hypothetical protein